MGNWWSLRLSWTPIRNNKEYKDSKEEIICTGSNECPEEYKYIIKDTKECVKSCPTNYHYNFNLECFESCENAKNSYQYPVKTVESLYECSCENLWRRATNGFVECLVDVNCKEDELLINETKECEEGCFILISYYHEKIEKYKTEQNSKINGNNNNIKNFSPDMIIHRYYEYKEQVENKYIEKSWIIWLFAH